MSTPETEDLAGSRQTLYERFFSGDVVRPRKRRRINFDKAKVGGRVVAAVH